LPRLYVYHADANDSISIERFRIMSVACRDHDHRRGGKRGTGRRDGGGGAIYLTMGWLRIKMLLVLMLIAYHSSCYKLMCDFAENRNTHSAKWYRGFNEVPSLLLIAIVLLAVVKPG